MRNYIRTRAGHRCSYCGEPDRGEEGSRFNLDHVVPRSAGGTSTKQNLVWSCVACNTAKAALAVDEFLKDKPDRLAGILAQLGQEADAEQDTGAPKDTTTAPATAVDMEQQAEPGQERHSMPRQKRKKQPAPCASCESMTTDLMPHKEMRNGIVVREKICHDCYFRALKSAIAEGDMSWARLNNEVQAVQDTIREQEAGERENAWRSDPATEKQLAFLKTLAAERKREIEGPEELTKGEASELIETLKKMPIRQACSCCDEEFGGAPDVRNRKYCDTCRTLTPAQRRKVASSSNPAVH